VPTDVKASLTRKLGPFPAWGWGVGIGGAILLYKVIHKGSPATAGPVSTPLDSNTGSGTPSGDQTGSGTSGDSTAISALQDQINSLTDQITQEGQANSAQLAQLTDLQTQLEAAQNTITGDQGTIAGLSGTIGNLTTFQTLQTQLSQLLDDRATTLYEINKWNTAYHSTTDPTKKAAYLAQVQRYTKDQATIAAQITAVQNQMAALNTNGAT
jgi:chromosome segregation ATPase